MGLNFMSNQHVARMEEQHTYLCPSMETRSCRCLKDGRLQFPSLLSVAPRSDPVADKYIAEHDGDEAYGDEWPQDGKEADLHRRQCYGDVDCQAGQPAKVVAKERAVLVPARHIAGKQGLPEMTYLVEPTEAELSRLKTRIDR